MKVITIIIAGLILLSSTLYFEVYAASNEKNSDVDLKESAIFVQHIVNIKPNQYGDFNSIDGIGIDPSGKIYLRFDASLERYSSDIKFEKKINLMNGGGYTFAFDKDGNVYVASIWDMRIFDKDATLLKQWKSSELENYDKFLFSKPPMFTVDSSKNMYFIEQYPPYMIHKFAPDGKLVHKWKLEDGSNPRKIEAGPNNNVYVTNFNSVFIYTTGGKFIKKYEFSDDNRIAELDVDSKGNFYLVKQNNNIEKFSDDGKLLARWKVDDVKLEYYDDSNMILDVDPQGNVLIITYDKSKPDAHLSDFNRVSKYSLLETKKEQAAVKQSQIRSELIKPFEVELNKKYIPLIKQEEEKIKTTTMSIAELEKDVKKATEDIDKANKDSLTAKNDPERFGYGLLIASKHGALKNKTLELEKAYSRLSDAKYAKSSYTRNHNLELGQKMLDMGLITETQKNSISDLSSKILKSENYFNIKAADNEMKIKTNIVDAKKDVIKKTEKKVDTKKTTEKKKVTKPANKATKSSDVKTTKTAKTMSDDCSIWASMYAASKDTANSYVESHYGKEEVSKRLADYITTDAEVTESIGIANEMAAKLIGSCGYNEKTIKSDFGGFNQNIIDSIEIYKGMAIGAVR